MPISCAGCSVTVPTLPASCGQNKKPGGIPYFAIVACDDATIIADPDDLSVWQAAVTANDARVVKNLLGSLPTPANTTRRTNSCAPEALLGKVWTLNLQDYDFTETGTSPVVYDKENFWNDIQNNPGKYYAFYGSCDGRMWLITDFTLMMNVEVPDNNADTRFMNIQVMWQGNTMGTQYVFDLGKV